MFARARLPALLLLLFAGCTASSSQVAPPQFDPYYPTGIAVSPDEKYLFILNANSDLRYDSGTLQVFDLTVIDDLAELWEDGETPDGCAQDPQLPTVLECGSSTERGDAASFVLGSSVKVGNFGSSLGVQELIEANGDAGEHLRVFATVRGDPSLTWVDFDVAAKTLDCGDTGDFPRCDEAHRLDRLQNEVDLAPLPDEPFYLFVDGANENVFVTHLTTGQVTLGRAPLAADKPPVLQDTLAGLFRPTAAGSLRAVGVAPRLPGDPGGLVYVTSSSESRIATLHVADGPETSEGEPTQRLVEGPSFYFSPIVADGLSGDARGIAFAPDGNRAFVVNRSPASILVYDTSVNEAESGAPRNEYLGSVEVCAQPSMLALADPGAGLRGYVPCFATGQVWVVDLDRRALVATADVGRGPNGVAAAATRHKVYVANYAEDTIAVVDVRPGSRTENNTILRLGQKRSAEDSQ